MEKHKKQKLKEDELTVLTILQQHAKEKIDNIAKKTGLSRQKICRIIKHLEEDNIIWNYSAITDGTEKGLQHFVLLVKRSTVPLDTSIKKEVIMKYLDEYLPNLVEIENIFVTHGRYNSVISFYSPDIVSAKKFYQEICRRLDKYIEEGILLQTLFPIRKQGHKNPKIANLADVI